VVHSPLAVDRRAARVSHLGKQSSNLDEHHGTTAGTPRTLGSLQTGYPESSEPGLGLSLFVMGMPAGNQIRWTSLG